MAVKHIDCSRFFRPVRYVLLQSFVSCFSVLSILLFARRKRSIPHHPESAIWKKTQIAVIFFSESGRSQNIPAVCKTDFAVAFSSLLIW